MILTSGTVFGVGVGVGVGVGGAQFDGFDDKSRVVGGIVSDVHDDVHGLIQDAKLHNGPVVLWQIDELRRRHPQEFRGNGVPHGSLKDNETIFVFLARKEVVFDVFMFMLGRSWCW